MPPDAQSALRAPRSALPVIGLVGGIGAGKSLVARLFSERGGVVVSGDVIAHEALRQPELRQRIVEKFGPEVLGDDGEIVRKKLAGPVFADERKLRELETIVFPWIGEKIPEAIGRAKDNAKTRFVVLDAAVMLEAGWNNVCDRIVYIHAPRAIRLTRLRERGWSQEQIASRERAQLPLTEKARRADAALDNGGTPEQTAQQIDDLIQQWNRIRADSGLGP